MTTTLLPYGDGGYSYEVVPWGGLPGFPKNYDSSGFASGGAPFSSGPSGGCGYNQATNWPSDTDLLTVHNVVVPAGASNISVSVGIDNDIAVYWDGTQIGANTHDGCASDDSFTYQVPPALSQPGTHQVAFRAHDRGDQTYFDATVRATIESPTISSVSPNWARYTGGTKVAITGTNFGSSPAVAFSDSCGIAGLFVNQATVLSNTTLGDGSQQLVVSVPPASSQDFPDGPYNVGQMHGKGCIDVFTAGGAVAKWPHFTYFVPQIGVLVYQTHARNRGVGFGNCTAEVVHSHNQSVVVTAAHCLGESGYTAYDFAFAPGYFGPQCPAAIHKGASLRFGCGGTAPDGIWCAKSSSRSFASHGLQTDADPGCGNSSGTAKALPGAAADPLNEDFAVLTLAPSNPAAYLGRPHGCPTRTSRNRLEACIGGGLNVAWDAGGNLGSASRQSWDLFGYDSSNYLHSCNDTPDPIFGSAYGQRAQGHLTITKNIDAGTMACQWVGPGDSGGAWLNDQNGFADGLGALNKVRDPNLILGTYLGTKARALWRSVQRLPAP